MHQSLVVCARTPPPSKNKVVLRVVVDASHAAVCCSKKQNTHVVDTAHRLSPLASASIYIRMLKTGLLRPAVF